MSIWCCRNANHPNDAVCKWIISRDPCQVVVSTTPINKTEGELLLEAKEGLLNDRNTQPSSKDATEIANLLVNLSYYREATYTAKFALRDLVATETYQQLMANLEVWATALNKLSEQGADLDEATEADLVNHMAEKATALKNALIELKEFMAKTKLNEGA